MSIYKDLLSQRPDPAPTEAPVPSQRHQLDNVQNLHHMLDQHLVESNWVMFSATHSGAGTTYIVYHLARHLSQTLSHGEQRLLVIDGNSQSPVLHHLLQAQNALGLSELLVTGKIEQVIQRDVLPNVDFISNGAGQLFYPEYLFKAKDSALIQTISQYRYILVDAPPLFAHPDALVLARMFPSVVLIAEYRRSKKDVVMEAKRRLTGSGATVIGGVINRIQHGIPTWIYNRI